MSEISEVQCRTARALLNWSQAELASKSNLSESTIRDFEKRRRTPSPNNLAAIEAAFRRAGVVLLDDGDTTGIGGEGVRFAEDSSGKRIEREIQEVEQELISARSLQNWLLEQIAVSDEMKNNINFRRLLDQSESEVRHLETRIMYLRMNLTSKTAFGNRIAEEMRKFEEEEYQKSKAIKDE